MFNQQIALNVVQSLLGLVAPGVRAVAYESVGHEITLYWLLVAPSSLQSELIEEAEGELDALTDGQYLIRSETSFTESFLNWEGKRANLVFRLFEDQVFP